MVIGEGKVTLPVKSSVYQTYVSANLRNQGHDTIRTSEICGDKLICRPMSASEGSPSGEENRSDFVARTLKSALVPQGKGEEPAEQKKRQREKG